MATDKYLSLFYPFDPTGLGEERHRIHCGMSPVTDHDCPDHDLYGRQWQKNMGFQREYAEPYEWVSQQFKDWAFYADHGHFVF